MTDFKALRETLERMDKEATARPWANDNRFALVGPKVDGDDLVIYDEKAFTRSTYYRPTHTEALANADLIVSLRNSLPQILTALRLAECVPEVEALLTLIAGHTGKTLIGDGTYSEGAHDAFNTLGGHAQDALAALQSAKAPT